MTVAAPDLSRLASVIGEIRQASCIQQETDELAIERLKMVSEQIRAQLLKSFVDEKPGFQLLYDALSGQGVPTAALSVCGRGTEEIRYTQLLRYFLDPKEPHGLDARILRAALISFDITPDKLDLKNARVQAEVSLGRIRTDKGRKSSSLDLMIEIDGTYVLIEHKINSAEGEGIGDDTRQVFRYDRAIEENLPHITDENSTRVYLTPSAKDAKGDVNWIPVSHKDLLRNMVPILDDKTLSPVARHNLCAFLWDLLMGPVGVDAQTISELLKHIHDALHVDDALSIRLKQWCDRKKIPWKLVIYILGKGYYEEDI